VHQRVHPSDGLLSWQVPAQVVCGTGDGGYRQANDAGVLVALNSFISGSYARGRMWIPPDQLDGLVLADPVGAVQCRRSEPG
jgi:hypothetical protein